MNRRIRKLLSAVLVVVTMGAITPVSAGANVALDAIVPVTHSQGLASATAVAVNSATGDVIVLDKDAAAVICFKSDGMVRWQATGGDLGYGLDIDCDGSRVYVLTSNRTSIRMLNASTGAFSGVLSHNVSPANIVGFTVKVLDGVAYAYVIDRYEFGRKVYKIKVADGTWTSPLLPFVDARDVAVDDYGRVWVTDASQGKVLRLNADGTTGTPVGMPGTGTGQLSAPEGIAVTSDNQILVADSTGRLQSFDPTLAANGVQLNTGSGASDVGAFGRFVTSGTDLVVADTQNRKAQRRTRSAYPHNYSAIQGEFGTPPQSANGKFSSPGFLASMPDGSVWVSDPGNNRVQSLSSTGTYLGQVGCSDPRGVATDGQYLYVVSGLGTINRYNAVTRVALGTWAGLGVGAGDGYFSNPQGIAIDPFGAVYVADTGNNRVQKFTPGGAWAASWDGFVAPRDLGFSANGHAFVYDAGGTRITEAKAGGIDRSVIASTLAGGDGGINVTGTERVWAADPGAGQLVTGWRDAYDQNFYWVNNWVSSGRGVDSTHLDDAADVAITPFGSGMWVSDRTQNRVFRCAYSSGGVPDIHANTSAGDWSSAATETFTVVSSVGDVGVKAIWTSLNGSAETTMWSMYDDTHLGDYSIPVSAEGTNTLDISFEDGLGVHHDALWHSQILIDRTRPTISATSSASGWSTEDVSVSATADDSLSGIESLTYQGYNGYFGDPYPWPYTEPTVITTEFPTTIKFTATDRAGLVASTTVLVRIDKTAPKTDLMVGTVEPAPTALTLVGTDDAATFPVVGGSGIAALSYRIDSGSTVTTSAPGASVPFSTPGTYSVEHWATDKVGHESEHTTEQVIVPDGGGGGGGGGGGDGVTVSGISLANGRTWVSTTTVAVHSDVTGATQMRFSGGSGVWTEWAPFSADATVTLLGPADTDAWSVCAEYRDDEGTLADGDAQGQLGLDRIAPVTQSTNATEDHWWTDPAFLTFIQGPSLSNAWVMCSVDGTAPVDATPGITVSGEGTHTIEWYCVDAAGNEETPHHVREIQVGEPTPLATTALTISPASATTWSYSSTKKMTVKGTLTSEGIAVPGNRTVDLYQRAGTTGTWIKITSVLTSGGAFSYPYAPTSSRYLRAEFAGDSEFDASAVNGGKVTVRAVVGTPYVSSSSVYRGRTYTFASIVRPRHTSGVTFRFYQYVNRKWVLRKTATTKYSTSGQPSDATKAYTSYAPPYRGSWKVTVTHSDSSHAAPTSTPYKTFTVR